MSSRCLYVPFLGILLAVWSAGLIAQQGKAVIDVVLDPATSGTLVFEGTPAGTVQVPAGGRATLEAATGSGTFVSSLASADAALSQYTLVSVHCDDGASSQASAGYVQQASATFRVEEGETVACTFALMLQPGMACTCPREGRWRVDNHPGSMVCTGAVSMTMPLTPSQATGTLGINEDCTRILAEGMSENEADLEMFLQPDCSWAGSVGGDYDGIPMTIDFRWTVENERRITGDLSSTVPNPQMTCRMVRTFSLDHES